MNVRCPNCESLYRIDPERVPAGGVLTRCSRCAEAFRVQAAGESPIDGAGNAGADAGAERPGTQPRAEREGSPERHGTIAPEAPPPLAGPPPAPAAPSSDVGAGASIAGLAPGDEPRATPAGPPDGPEAPAEPSSEPHATGTAAGAGVPQPADGTAAGSGAAARPRTPVFGKQDPDTRAQRIARALVSDMVVYNADRRDRSLEQGTLRADFKEEILKSWEEYVEQVGQEMARKSPHFRDALNEILARGQSVF